jgi:hypothetical protein
VAWQEAAADDFQTPIGLPEVAYRFEIIRLRLRICSGKHMAKSPPVPDKKFTVKVEVPS